MFCKEKLMLREIKNSQYFTKIRHNLETEAAVKIQKTYKLYILRKKAKLEI